MKICIIGNKASSTIKFRKHMIECLHEKGHEIYVLANDYTIETKQKVEHLGGKPIDYSLDRGGINPLTDFSNLLKLYKTIKNISPDVVFSYFSKPSVFGTISARLAKVPRIIAMLEGLGYSFTTGSRTKREKIKKIIIKSIQIALYNISFKSLDKLIVLNEDDALEIGNHNILEKKKIVILGGIGVDLENFHYTTPQINPVRFIFIGRLLKEKGIHEYLDAAKQVKKIHPSSEFFVLGEVDNENPGSLKSQELHSFINEKIIIYPGHVKDVKEWIEKSSVFVLPSYREGVPCSTQEAMACGRAIITTDSPGCKETIFNSENGIKIEIQNSSALANAMLFFINNKENIISMGKISRKYAEIYFDEKKQTESLINSIIYQNE